MSWTSEIEEVECHGCQRHCALLLEVKQGLVVEVRGNPDHPLNKGFKCRKPDRVIGEQLETARQKLCQFRSRTNVRIVPG